MSVLRFDVLGPLRVTVAGREVELGPARRRTALAALLVDAGRIVPVETLIDRIWDSDPGVAAQGSLQSYVSRLRAALRAAGGGDSVLLTAPPGYRLDVEPAALDAAGLDTAVVDARRLRDAGEVAAARDRVDELLATWRGEPYADITATFLDAERLRLGARRDAARELRAQLSSELGDHDQAVDGLVALVAEQPLREPLHAALMLALYRGGRAAEALQHYAAVGERLADELGVDPGAVLRDLHSRILREDPSLTPVRTAQAPVPSAVSPPAPATSLAPAASATAAMIGRGDELARCLATLDAVWTSGSAHAVALVGEAGIGKSRLAEEIATRATASTATVIWSRTWQHGEAPVLWPWLQAIRRLATAVGPDVTARALQGRAAPLGTLLPDLPGALPPAPAGSTTEPQLPVFEAVEAFLRVAAVGRRVVVVLEDLQWAEAATHRLTEYLVGHTDGVPVALVTAVRTPVEDAGGRVRDLLAAFARTGRTTRVDLVGLGVDDVRAYVGDRTGSDLDEATAAALVDRTGGNPFYVGELVALFSDGAVDTSLQVPMTVRDVVRLRVADLGAAPGRVLATASLMVRTFDLDLLERVSGLDEDVVDEAVDLATAAGLLCSEPGSPGLHRFTHALVADAVAESVGPARRQRQHARTADVLDARLAAGTQVATGQLVHHLVATGDPWRIERAVELCCEAGGAARRRHDLAESESVLRQALELVTRLAPARAERWELAVRTRLGALSVLIHGIHHPDTVAERRRCRQLLGGVGTAREVAALQAQAWGAAMVVADFGAAHAISDEIAETAAASRDELVQATAAATLGETLFHQGRVPEARTALDRAVGLLRAAGPMPLEFALGLASPPTAWEMWLAVCTVLVGEADDLPAALVGRLEAQSASDPQLAAFTLGPLAIAGCFRDDPERTEEPARRAEELAETAGLQHLLGYYRLMANWAQVRRAPEPDPAAVQRMIVELEEFDGWPTMLMRPFHLGLCADALMRIGRPADAATRLDRAIAETRRTGNAQVLVENHRLRAIAWSQLGRPDATVLAELTTAAEIAADQGTVLFGRRVEKTTAALGLHPPI